MQTLALAGNPNCGKTTLFNKLTGAHQHVGNWAGVTVERREGIVRGSSARLVDLPGLYSLAAFTLEEQVTREFLLDGSYDAVINLLDGTSLERGLYLTLQLCELGCPMAVGIGMMDEVRAPVSYTHLRAHETGRNLVCRLLLEKKKKKKKQNN